MPIRNTKAHMRSGRIFLDSNVLLEFTLQGRKHAEVARRYNDSHETVISPLTAQIYVYFGQKDGIPTQLLLSILQKYEIGQLGASELSWATEHCQGEDFEDALQVACAISAGAVAFATFNKLLAQRYKSFITMKILGS